jgi:hypothetical protein
MKFRKLAGTRKRKPKKSKAKKSKEEKIIAELCGFKLGDKIWYRTTLDLIGYGVISKFYTEDKMGPAVQVYDEINHGFRCGLISTASATPPKGGTTRLNRSRAQIYRDSVKKKK